MTEATSTGVDIRTDVAQAMADLLARRPSRQEVDQMIAMVERELAGEPSNPLPMPWPERAEPQYPRNRAERRAAMAQRAKRR